MPFNDEELALLDAIHADPRNDTPRLAYADWLIERGDRRGQFIRAQCSDKSWMPTRSASGFGRTQPKRWDHYSNPPWPEPGWHRPMPSPLEFSGYHRGLALLYYPPTTSTPLTQKDWNRILRRVTRAARLSIFLPYTDNFQALICHPLMQRVDILAIAHYSMTNVAVEALSKCPYLHQLSALNMRNLDESGQAAFTKLIKPVLPFATSGEMVHAGGAMYSLDFVKRIR
jgi:uncharacterized protein (TIGR02996 family)